ncbi:HNH endonuclease family protein [uncultured Bifidobacterium sp.]|uniref:HNH endonuclease family protein n=1 Tax=uncultured Bifidobacterium sp. TaxID=165187 RepID=UPI0037DC2B4D
MRRRSARFRRPLLNAGGLVERLLVLAAVAVVAGILLGLLLPRMSDTIGEITGRFAVSGPAAAALEGLAVDDHPTSAGYDRDAFGYRMTDADSDGCDVRDEVLARDLENVRYDPTDRCTVRRGTLRDPYTAATIRFVRGPSTSSAVQIDHVVALENAWRSGARNWGIRRRWRFGNDMRNLLAVEGEANGDKSSASAAYWLPENRGFRCDYVARQIAVKWEYALTVTTPERRSMLGVLRSCPGQSLPRQ